MPFLSNLLGSIRNETFDESAKCFVYREPLAAPFRNGAVFPASASLLPTNLTTHFSPARTIHHVPLSHRRRFAGETITRRSTSNLSLLNATRHRDFQLASFSLRARCFRTRRKRKGAFRDSRNDSPTKGKFRKICNFARI